MTTSMIGLKCPRVLLVAAYLFWFTLCSSTFSMDSGQFASLMRYERCIGPAACACGLASGASCCLVGYCAPKAVMCALCAPCAACWAGAVCKTSAEQLFERRANRAVRTYMRQLERCSLAALSDDELNGQLRCVDDCQCLLNACRQRQLGMWPPGIPNPVLEYEREQCDRQREDIQFHLSRRACDGCCW